MQNMSNQKKIVIAVLVNNQFGVLTRVSSLFSRRGFNIDSLTVGVTENPAFSRMTIGATGDEYMQRQIVKQLSKLEDVKKVIVMQENKTVLRELMLIKVQAEAGKRSEILEAVSIYRANVVDLANKTLAIELTGETSKIDAFIEYLRPYGISELCRTGLSAMERGNDAIIMDK